MFVTPPPSLNAGSLPPLYEKEGDEEFALDCVQRYASVALNELPPRAETYGLNEINK